MSESQNMETENIDITNLDISENDNSTENNNNIEESNDDNSINYLSNMFSDENINELKERINKKKDSWLNAEKFPEFLNATIKGIVILTVYFYFGVNFHLLSKNVQLNPKGLRGQNLEGPPYIGNFSECENDFDLSKPISEWSFPYKNSILCDVEANQNRPVYYRLVNWFVSIIAFSYAMGRKVLNLFLKEDDMTTNILLGPIIIMFLLFITPLFGWGSSIIGMFMNYAKLLPCSYYTFWFPITTAIFALITFFFLPSNIAIIQFFTMLYYLVFHVSISKIDIEENGEKTKTRGFMSILSKIVKNSTWLLFILIITAINAYKYLGPVFGSPIFIWIGIYIFFKHIKYLLS
jgi:hypothetical protein